MYARYIPPQKPGTGSKGENIKSKDASKKHKRKIKHERAEEKHSTLSTDRNDAGETQKAEAIQPEDLPSSRRDEKMTKKREDAETRKSHKKKRTRDEEANADGNTEAENVRRPSSERTDIHGQALQETATQSHGQGKKSKRKRKSGDGIEVLPETRTPGVEGAEAEDIASKHQKILSKYHRSTKAAKEVADVAPASPSLSSKAVESDHQEAPDPEAAALVPLPQPSPVPEVQAQPTYSTLPSWLAQPVIVSHSGQKPFKQYEIAPKLVSSLESKGFKDALPIQSAVLPLLLPGREQHDGDLCISAATGSGKTLAYVIPLIESLRSRVVVQLRGLIVVPTRELVAQARDVCELCGIGSDLRIHTAVGNRPFKVEQEELVEKVQQFDPVAAKEGNDRKQNSTPESDYDPAMDDLEVDDLESGFLALPRHRVTYQSRVDILICTPGRLVDHVRHTRGFNLDHLQWLVIDEADKLLGQSFQGWLDAVIGSLQRDIPFEELSADQKISRTIDWWQRPRLVRKVILSATMTRDLSKLNALRLRSPKLVLVEDVDKAELPPDGPADGVALVQQIPGTAPGDAYELPATLEERVVPVGDASQKPLYLLQLLETKISVEDGKDGLTTGSLEATSSSASDQSDMEDPSYSESDTSASPLSSDTASEVGSAGEFSDHPEGDPSFKQLTRKLNVARHTDVPPAQTNRGVLIFTRSNESAVRLSRLLSLLQPAYTGRSGTLTSTQPSSERRKTLRGFTSNKLSILIASNLVSRGMDIPNLAHVINYDVPSSVRDYVHRVGRTARAGKEGQAWTLLADKEAGWFWNAIARGSQLRRAALKTVARLKLDLGRFAQEDGQATYAQALEKLGEEVRMERR